MSSYKILMSNWKNFSKVENKMPLFKAVFVIGLLTVSCQPIEERCDLAGCNSVIEFQLPEGVDGPFLAQIDGETVNGTVINKVEFSCNGEESFIATGIIEDEKEATMTCHDGKRFLWAVGGDRGAGPGPLLLHADVRVTMQNAALTTGTPLVYRATSSSISYVEVHPNGTECAPTCFLPEVVELSTAQ